MARFVYDFSRPSVTATVVIFHEDGRRFLTGKRSKTTRAYPDCDSVPGGFLDSMIREEDILKGIKDHVLTDAFKKFAKSLVRPGETAEDAAVREILEETNLQISKDRLVQFWTCSDPELDPRCHVVNVCFYVVVNDMDLITLQAGDDLQSVEWVENDLLVNPSYSLAFNHAQIARRAYKAWSDARELEAYRAFITSHSKNHQHYISLADQVHAARQMNGES